MRDGVRVDLQRGEPRVRIEQMTRERAGPRAYLYDARAGRRAHRPRDLPRDVRVCQKVLAKALFGTDAVENGRSGEVSSKQYAVSSGYGGRPFTAYCLLLTAHCLLLQ